MTWLDYAVICVFALSIAWGVWRGLVREIMSLAGWVIAFLAANLFAALRALDRPDFAGIAVMPVPERDLGVAINDRLRRAAHR